MPKKRKDSEPLPTIVLDSRPVYLVNGYEYGTYDDAIKHILRDRIATLYNDTGIGDDPSSYAIGGWVADNLDQIIALRAEVKTITATRKETTDA